MGEYEVARTGAPGEDQEENNAGGALMILTPLFTPLFTPFFTPFFTHLFTPLFKLLLPLSALS